MTMGLGHLVDQGQKRQLGHMAFGRRGQRRKPAQNLTASFRLLQKKIDVFAHRALGRHSARHFLRDQRDRRKRRAELMGRRSCKAVERGQVLLALKNEFGGAERVRQRPGFRRDAIDVSCREDQCADDRVPEAGHIDGRQREQLPIRPGQRQMKDGQERGGECCKDSKAEGRRGWLGRGRDQRRNDQKDRERIVDAAGQKEQPGRLENVEGQNGRRRHRRQAPARRVTRREPEIEPDRQSDQTETEPDGKGPPNAPSHEDDRRDLPGDR